MLSRTDRIGDVILALPAARVIKEHYRNSKLLFLVSDYTAPLLQNSPYIDEIVTLSGTETILDLVRIFRKHKVDTLVFIFPVFKIALASFLARIPIRIGSAFRTYNLLFNRRLWENRRPSVRHESEYNLSMLRLLGIQATDVSSPQLFITEEERRKGESILSKLQRPRIIIHAGSVTQNERNWPLKNYLNLAKRLPDFGISVIFTGTKAESDFVKDYLPAGPPYLDLMGRLSLRHLMAVIAASHLIISGSTGPMHVAAALGIPTISFFVPLRRHNPIRWRPLGNEQQIILPDNSCSDNCNFCKYRPCLNTIQMDEVIEKILNLLKKKGYKDGRRTIPTKNL